jgi:hypothetical protein
MEYRKRIEIDRDKDYVFVELEQGVFMNGGSSYPFPTEETARRFAVNTKRAAVQRGVERHVSLRFPDGQIEEIPNDV